MGFALHRGQRCEKAAVEEVVMDDDDTDNELLGRLVAEYSKKITRLREALLWVSEHSSDLKAVDRALHELKR